MPENTTVYEICRRMAARRVDAALLTDSNALLCGILTDKDIATRVIARKLKLEDTPVSSVMTRNPVFVLSDTLAVEALQKMVLGNFRHLPVVENGEVIALLDIAKCLYDAIARMERAAEKGKAIAAAVEGVEKYWGTSVSGPNTFVEALRERMFRPSLSSIISGSSKVLTVLPTDSVLVATRKMLEIQISSAIVTVGNKPYGILTSSDILMRVIAENLSPESTSVEKVMTPNPECGTIDTPILDALHIMHNGKFLHLPVLDRDGNIFSVIDVIHVTQAAVSTVENSGGVRNEGTASMMQKFWDSAMAIETIEEDDETRSEASMKLASDGTETFGSPAYPRSGSAPTFAFKIEDKKGRMHRFYCDARTLTELITCILQRVSDDIDRNRLPQILYEDEDHDKVVLASDSDLAAAVEHARVIGWTLDSLEKKDTHTTSMLKCPLEKEEPSALRSETGDCDAKDVRMDEIVKELRAVKRQNLITHCLLSVLIVVTTVWQFSEASFLLNIKERVSHPMRAVGDMVAGSFKWKGKKPAVEAPPLPPIAVPELPRLDLPHLTFDGAGSEE